MPLFLSEELQKITELIPHAQKSNPVVSKKGIDWHLSHSLKVINGICKALIVSDSSEYKHSFNIKRSYVFLTGGFPRGVGKAPKAVSPSDQITEEDLLNQINKVRAIIPELSTLPLNSHFKHPYFGMLNLERSKKFLIIHTNHHFKIIKDILKNQ